MSYKRSFFAFLLWSGVFLGLVTGCSTVRQADLSSSESTALNRVERGTVPAEGTAAELPTEITPSPPTGTPQSQITDTAVPLPCGTDWCVLEGHLILTRPIADTKNDWVEPSYPFGSTLNGEREPHHGVEFTNPGGTPVLAVRDGVVVVAGSDHETQYGLGTDFYGNLVILQHSLPDDAEPFYTLYAHLSQVEVQVGQNVSAGEEIGRVGKTGKAMGVHLHFEVRIGGMGYDDVRNPELWLKPHTGNGVLVGQIINPEGETRYFPDIKITSLATATKPKVYRPEPYADPHLKGDENYQEVFAIGDLPAGTYQISFSPPGVSEEMTVEIVPGKVTLVTLHAKY